MNKTWSDTAKGTITKTKHFLSDLAIKVRTEQFNIFLKNIKPQNNDKVADIGVSSDEILKETNLFEKLYPYPENLTAVTIEEKLKLKKLYPKIKVVKIKVGEKLPFKNSQFDIVTSWATLEHVGSFENQKKFINEILRVGKRVFITIPYRGCIYEPHTGFFFLHWLPLKIFRWICKKTGREFWSQDKNLNPLYISDLKKMLKNYKTEIIIYKMFWCLPSHLIIIKL